MVIFIPKGDSNDPTTNPEEFDSIANFLLDCAVTPLT
jgi:hypothetical protein